MKAADMLEKRQSTLRRKIYKLDDCETLIPLSFVVQFGGFAVV